MTMVMIVTVGATIDDNDCAEDIIDNGLGGLDGSDVLHVSAV